MDVQGLFNSVAPRLPNLSAATARALAAVAALVAVGCGRPAGAVPPIPEQVVGHCIYINGFSGREECREYRGAGWTPEAATADCRGRSSNVVLAAACNYPQIYGRCLLNARSADVVLVSFPGNSAAQCSGARTGCEFFGGGYFLPEPVCDGADGGVAGDGGLPVFQPPVRECRAPRAGEPAGQSAGGQVCTWSAISASTESGRRFEDYASCDRVRTQRPYYPVPPAPSTRTEPDARLQDATYRAELSWVRGQIESSGCICCHSNRLAPRGPSNWYVEAEGNWMDTFHNAGLALGAGWIDSTAFGAYPAADNNGFARTTSGFPSTDPARMARFFQRELEQRGLSREAFNGATPFGGPIYQQLIHRPVDCTDGQGISTDGTVRWTGGSARYVYVLAAGSANPGVPPNLDTPDGTLWRIDVPSDGAPIASGLRYGTMIPGTSQRVPASGNAPPLAAGSRYYLYVMQDVGIPITRCTFTFPR